MFNPFITTFDTTFKTNKHNMKLGFFLTLGNSGTTLIQGFALMTR